MKRVIAVLSLLAVLLTGSAAVAATTTVVEIPPAPTTADGWTHLFADKNDQTWSGGDQVTSYQHNGHTYWLFGDSMLSAGTDLDGSYPDGTVMVSNRILRQNGATFVNAVGEGNGIPDPATHTPANQDRYWAQGMFAANGHLYVIGQRVESDGNNGFRFGGADLFKYAQAADGTLTLVSVSPTPSARSGNGIGPMQIQWSSDAVVSGGYVYVYGATLSQGNAFVAHWSYVARVPAGQVENPTAWRFYARTSGTWKARLSDLNQNVGDQPDAILAGQVSSVRKIGARWVLLHKPWNGWGSDIKATTATTPVGPWTPEVTVLSSPAGTDEHGHQYQTYSPQLHPEQTLASGRVLVSIAWNGTTLADTLADADLYKPRFHEIDLPTWQGSTVQRAPDGRSVPPARTAGRMAVLPSAPTVQR